MYSAGALAIGGIWTKSLAFAADAEELIFLYGFSMAVSPFDRPGVPEARSSIKVRTAQRGLLSLKSECCSWEKAVPRTRDSVRRASDFVQIALSLTNVFRAPVYVSFTSARWARSDSVTK